VLHFEVASSSAVLGGRGRLMRRLEPAVLGYTILRLGIGMSMLIHGVGRVGNIRFFAEQLVSHFSKTWLPDAMVVGFAYMTPPVELLIGNSGRARPFHAARVSGGWVMDGGADLR